jgi:hypothetical protein
MIGPQEEIAEMDTGLLGAEDRHLRLVFGVFEGKQAFP